jgi:ankyrin repeat protein
MSKYINPMKDYKPYVTRTQTINKYYVPDNIQNQELINELFLKAQNSDITELKKFLVNANIPLNVRSEKGDTILHFVLKNGDLTDNQKTEIANFLIERGAPVNGFNDENITPLHLASKYQLNNIVDTLIKYGANVNATDNNYMTPLHYAVQGTSTECRTVRKEMLRNLIDAEEDLIDEMNLDLGENKKELLPEIEELYKEVLKNLRDIKFTPYLQHIKKIFDYNNLKRMIYDECNKYSKNIKKDIENIFNENQNSQERRKKINEKLRDLKKDLINEIEKNIKSVLIETNFDGDLNNNITTKDAEYYRNNMKDINEVIFDTTGLEENKNDLKKIINELSDTYKKIIFLNEGVYQNHGDNDASDNSVSPTEIGDILRNKDGEFMTKYLDGTNINIGFLLGKKYDEKIDINIKDEYKENSKITYDKDKYKFLRITNERLTQIKKMNKKVKHEALPITMDRAYYNYLKINYNVSGEDEDFKKDVYEKGENINYKNFKGDYLDYSDECLEIFKDIKLHDLGNNNYHCDNKSIFVAISPAAPPPPPPPLPPGAPLGAPGVPPLLGLAATPKHKYIPERNNYFNADKEFIFISPLKVFEELLDDKVKGINIIQTKINKLPDAYNTEIPKIMEHIHNYYLIIQQLKNYKSEIKKVLDNLKNIYNSKIEKNKTLGIFYSIYLEKAVEVLEDSEKNLSIIDKIVKKSGETLNNIIKYVNYKIEKEFNMDSFKKFVNIFVDEKPVLNFNFIDQKLKKHSNLLSDDEYEQYINKYKNFDKLNKDTINNLKMDLYSKILITINNFYNPIYYEASPSSSPVNPSLCGFIFDNTVIPPPSTTATTNIDSTIVTKYYRDQCDKPAEENKSNSGIGKIGIDKIGNDKNSITNFDNYLNEHVYPIIHYDFDTYLNIIKYNILKLFYDKKSSLNKLETEFINKINKIIDNATIQKNIFNILILKLVDNLIVNFIKNNIDIGSSNLAKYIMGKNLEDKVTYDIKEMAPDFGYNFNLNENFDSLLNIKTPIDDKEKYALAYTNILAEEPLLPKHQYIVHNYSLIDRTHKTCFKIDNNMANKLIENRANIYAKDVLGNTPIHYIIEMKNTELFGKIQEIIKKNNDKDKINKILKKLKNKLNLNPYNILENKINKQLDVLVSPNNNILDKINDEINNKIIKNQNIFKNNTIKDFKHIIPIFSYMLNQMFYFYAKKYINGWTFDDMAKLCEKINRIECENGVNILPKFLDNQNLDKLPQTDGSDILSSNKDKLEKIKNNLEKKILDLMFKNNQYIKEQTNFDTTKTEYININTKIRNNQTNILEIQNEIIKIDDLLNKIPDTKLSIKTNDIIVNKHSNVKDFNKDIKEKLKDDKIFIQLYNQIVINDKILKDIYNIIPASLKYYKKDLYNNYELINNLFGKVIVPVSKDYLELPQEYSLNKNYVLSQVFDIMNFVIKTFIFSKVLNIIQKALYIYYQEKNKISNDGDIDFIKTQVKEIINTSNIEKYLNKLSKKVIKGVTKIYEPFDTNKNIDIDGEFNLLSNVIYTNGVENLSNTSFSKNLEENIIPYVREYTKILIEEMYLFVQGYMNYNIDIGNLLKMHKLFNV